mgnify:CR=1 FL=1
MVRIGGIYGDRHSEPLGRYALLLAGTKKVRQTIEYRIGHACTQWIDVERENEWQSDCSL